MANSNATLTRNILVDFPDWASEKVLFDLESHFAAATNEGFPEKRYTLDLDGSGTGTQALPVPSTGAWAWTVRTPDGNKYDATLASGSDLQLTTWLASAISTETAASLADQFVAKAGDIMIGLLQFDGTDHAGLQLLSLTTTERDALTPAEGMVIYNETTVQVEAYQNGSWGPFAAGLSNVVEDTTPQLGGDLDAQGNNVTDLGDVTFKTGAQGGTLRTGTANADKFVLAAYDVNDGVYRTVIELDAGNEVVMQLIADFLAIEDNADTTKHVEWDLSGATGSTTTTLLFVQTVDRSITFPDETGTVLTNQGGTLAGDFNMADNLITRPVIKDYGETTQALGGLGGGAVNIDLESGNVVTATIDTSSTTITFTNWPASGTAGSVTCFFTNPGSQTLAITNAVWPGGTAPTWTVSGVDIAVFSSVDAGATVYALVAGQDMQ